ncbi:Fur family transcriptional regulator [Streptomyces sp. LaPpAH-108]|uniref:Fur family transcriptional regulator n=1 Tax=Streptomyces sp. LaPpAH-108 TaxID=1155714 RepID=UPI0003776297|nr:transcriptional repressor [Streptomyces sp. LaPpAH-108]
MKDALAKEQAPSWRSTRQRAATLRALRDATGFVSATELHAALTADGVTIGLTTVYRTLRVLERTGHVDVVREKTGERLYRPRPADGHRHYLVCRHCGHSRPVDADSVERWAESLTASTGFTAVEHTLELTGVCGPCRSGPAPSPR